MCKSTFVEKRECKIPRGRAIPGTQIKPVKFPLNRKSIYAIGIVKYYLIICILLC